MRILTKGTKLFTCKLQVRECAPASAHSSSGLLETEVHVRVVANDHLFIELCSWMPVEVLDQGGCDIATSRTKVWHALDREKIYHRLHEHVYALGILLPGFHSS